MLKCNRCLGTGIKIDFHENLIREPCEDCNGAGILDLKKMGMNICYKCIGSGILYDILEKNFHKCKICNGLGYIDWIDNVIKKK